jgi:hypothetical protein
MARGAGIMNFVAGASTGGGDYPDFSEDMGILVDMFSEKFRLKHIGNNEVAHALPHVTHNVETIVRSQ